MLNKTTTEPSFKSDSPDICIFKRWGAPADAKRDCTAIGSVPDNIAPNVMHKLVLHEYGSMFPATRAVNAVPPSTIGKAKIINCQNAYKRGRVKIYESKCEE